DVVEVAGPDLTLMPGGGIAALLRLELGPLQAGVGRHTFVAVSVGEVEHGVVERVEPGEGDELEAVTHLSELLLEARDLLLGEVALPVERGRTVVGEQFPGITLVDPLRELPRLPEVRGGRLAPDDVRVRSVG